MISEDKEYTYWFEVTDVCSEYDGEQFFVESHSWEEAMKTAQEVFPNTWFKYHGRVTQAQADFYGFDIY